MRIEINGTEFWAPGVQYTTAIYGFPENSVRTKISSYLKA